MSESIQPQIDLSELMILQLIQRQTEERRKDKYRDPDRYPREELRRAVQEIVAMHIQGYIEAEAQRGNATACALMDTLLSKPSEWPWAWPKPEPPPLAPQELHTRAFYNMHTNALFCRFVDSATHSALQEIEAFLDAREEARER